MNDLNDTNYNQRRLFEVFLSISQSKWIDNYFLDKIDFQDNEENHREYYKDIYIYVDAKSS